MCFTPSCHSGVCVYESVLGGGVEGWRGGLWFLLQSCVLLLQEHVAGKGDVLWSYLFILHLACLLLMHLGGCRPPRHRERMWATQAQGEDAGEGRTRSRGRPRHSGAAACTRSNPYLLQPKVGTFSLY